MTNRLLSVAAAALLSWSVLFDPSAQHKPELLNQQRHPVQRAPRTCASSSRNSAAK